RHRRRSTASTRRRARRTSRAIRDRPSDPKGATTSSVDQPARNGGSRSVNFTKPVSNSLTRTGPYSLATILNQVQTAKMSGVVMPDGSKVYPDAVWVINSHRLEEPRRRNAQDVRTLPAANHALAGTLRTVVSSTRLVWKSDALVPNPIRRCKGMR